MKKYEVIPFNEFMSMEKFDLEAIVKNEYNRKGIKKLQKLSVFLWTVSASFTAKAASAASTAATAANSSQSFGLWSHTTGLFGVFQEMAMVLGALAIFGGLITMIFKKRAGQKIILTAAIAIGGCFLVPSAIMLVAIIGNMLNDTLSQAFSSMTMGR
jgi:hypothetical protein